MSGWFAPSTAERRWLPEDRRRPTPWVIAIMMFVTLVVATAGLVLANSARTLAAGAEQRWSVQIPDGSRLAPAALAAARSAPGVIAAKPVSETEIRATLEQWLGPEAAASAGLPIPALIDLDLAPGADSRAIAARIETAAPGSRLVAFADRLAPLLGAVRALQWLALALVAMMALATAAAVVLATQGAFDINRPTIDVMHGIGATDEQLAALFQRRIALDALAGGLSGAAAAGLVLLGVAAIPGSLLGDLGGGALLRPIDLVALALLPIAATLLAMRVARAAVMKALRERL